LGGLEMTMTTYVCSDPDHEVISIASLQPDPAHPIDAARLEAVARRMAAGEALPALVVRPWKGQNFRDRRLAQPARRRAARA
jgi:hypothetical protein